MTIEIVTGDLLKAFDNGEINFMAHCCNMQNVMGAGIANKIKRRFPEAFHADHRWFITKHKGYSNLSLAKIHGDRYIANVYGQVHYNAKVKQLNEEYLRTGLIQLAQCMNGAHDVLGLPYNMGCGLAGGNWNDVYKIIEEVFVNHQVKIYKL